MEGLCFWFAERFEQHGTPMYATQRLLIFPFDLAGDELNFGWFVNDTSRAGHRLF